MVRDGIEGHLNIKLLVDNSNYLNSRGLEINRKHVHPILSPAVKPNFNDLFIQGNLGEIVPPSIYSCSALRGNDKGGDDDEGTPRRQKNGS